MIPLATNTPLESPPEHTPWVVKVSQTAYCDAPGLHSSEETRLGTHMGMNSDHHPFGEGSLLKFMPSCKLALMR